MQTYIIILLPLSLVAVDGLFCKKEDAQNLLPCGNKEEYGIITSGWETMSWDAIGDFCIGQSTTVPQADQTWFDARRQCQSQGYDADLVEFDDNKVWDRFKSLLDNDQVHYWTRGRKTVQNSDYTYYETNLTHISSTDPRWAPGTPYLQVGCMATRNKRWYDLGCSERHQWICQMRIDTPIADFRFSIYPEVKGQTLYKVGQHVSVQCSVRAQRGLIVTIVHPVTKKIYKADADRNEDGKLIEAGVYYVATRKPVYLMVGPRCYALNNIQLHMYTSHDRNQSTLSCCVAGKDVCKSKTIKVAYVRQRPLVRLKFQNTENVHYVGEVATYLCVARLGMASDSNTVTIAVIQRDGSYWGLSYTRDGQQKEVGRRPHWSNRMDITHVSDTHDWWGGNYINVTLKFVTIYDMTNARIACYSEDVLDKVENKSINIGDEFSVWKTFNVTDSLLKPRFEFKRLPTRPDSDGKIPVYGCDVIDAVCIAHVGTNGSLEFSVTSQNESATWEYRGDDTLPEWVTVSRARDYVDLFYGPTIDLRLAITVTSEITEANMSCAAIRGTAFMSEYQKFPFKVEIGTLPPLLEAKEYPADDPTYVLELNCTTQVGWGDTQSWDLLDHRGNKYRWIVLKTGQVHTRAPISWVELQFSGAMWDNTCGETIYSSLKVKKRSRRAGATFTCYSYDIWGNFNSPYTSKQLMATYDLFGGGSEKRYESDADTSVYVLFAAVMISLFFISLMACFQIRNTAMWRHFFGEDFAKGQEGVPISPHSTSPSSATSSRRRKKSTRGKPSRLKSFASRGSSQRSSDSGPMVEKKSIPQAVKSIS